jgi:hypothetical protein
VPGRKRSCGVTGKDGRTSSSTFGDRNIMCTGGGGGGGGTAMYQLMLQQMQMQQQAAASAAALKEQQREFDTSQANREQDIASQKQQQDQVQAQADQQAALTQQWQTGRTQEAGQATDAINQAFAQFTPDYYSGYVKAYEQNYDPEVERQYGIAKQQLGYGLARQGIGQSQSAATQQGLLAQDKGRQEATIANQAVDASTQLQGNVENAKQSLLATALSDQTLGSPITPGSADAITAQFDQTSKALSQVTSQAGDVVGTLSAPPTYNALGNLFGNAASGVASYASGNLMGSYNQAYNQPSATASSPSSSSSARVVG